MNWLDLLIGGILLVSLIGALRNGLTREVVRIVAMVFGLFAAMWFYSDLARAYAPYIPDPRIAQFLAFLSIVFGCLIGGGFVAWILETLVGFAGMRWFDRLLGAGFGLVRGLAIATALVLGMVAFGPVTQSERVVADSQLAPWVLSGARAALYLAPRPLREAYNSGFERVREAARGGASESAEAVPRAPIAPGAKPSPVTP